VGVWRRRVLALPTPTALRLASPGLAEERGLPWVHVPPPPNRIAVVATTESHRAPTTRNRPTTPTFFTSSPETLWPPSQEERTAAGIARGRKGALFPTSPPFCRSDPRGEVGSRSRRDANRQTRRLAALLVPPTICQMDRSDPIASPSGPTSTGFRHPSCTATFRRPGHSRADYRADHGSARSR
jgi:hypothetical protein